MALYSVLGPDGNTYNIEGPEGAKEQDVLAAAQQIYYTSRQQQLSQEIERLRSEPIRPEETSGFGAARAASVQNIQADLAALAGKTGAVDEKKAEEFIAAKQKEAARVFTPTQDSWLESPWLKFKELAGGSLPYMVAPVAAGVAAAALPVVGIPTVAGLGMGLAGLASATQFAGSNLSRQLAEQEGTQSLAKTELAPALAAAPFQAALDIVSLRMIPGLGRVFQAAGKELTEEQLKAIAQRGLVNNVARSGAKTASAEGLTEVGQQIIERAQAGLNITDEKARDEYLDSLIGGAVLGGAVGAPAGIGARGRAQRKLDARNAPVEYSEQGQLFSPEELQQAEQATQGPRPPADAGVEEVVTRPEPPTNEAPAQGSFDFTDPRQAELEETFNSQQPDLLGDIVPPRQPEEVQAEAPTAEISQADPRQRALQFVPPAPEPEAPAALTPRQRDTLRQAERQKQQALRQQEFEAAEAQRAEQNRAQLDRGAQETFADQAAGIFPPTFPEAKAGQPAQAQPAQLDLFKRKDAPVPSRAEGLRRGVGEQMGEIVPLEQTSFELTAKSLADIGIPPTAPIYKNIIDRDLADPEQRVNVSAALRKYASNPLVPKATKAAIGKVLQESPFLRTQAELDFTKRQPKPKGAQNVGTATAPQPTAKSSASKPSVDVGVPSIEAKAPTKGKKGAEGVSEPKQSGLGDTGGRAKPDDAGEVSEQYALEEKTRKWDKDNRTRRSDAWSDGALQANPMFEDVKTQGSSIPAHGMSKVSTLGEGVKNLIEMVKGGIRPGLYFESLTRPDKAAGTGSATGTAGGVAYRDGPFIITFRKGVTNPTSADVTGVLVNPSNAEIIPELRALLPNIRIESYQDVQKLLGAPKAEKKSAPVVKKEVEAEADRNTDPIPYVPSDPNSPRDAKSLEYYKNTLNPELKKHISFYEGLIARGRGNKNTQLRLDNARAHLAENEDFIAKGPTAKPAVNPFDAMVNEVQKGIDAPPTWASKTIYKLEEALDASVPESVQAMLRAGDLKGALQALASASDGVTKRIVTALVKAVGGTKVNIVTDLRDEAGNKVSGTFDPETNTISLDADTGLTNHTVLHEMTHAAISHILDNPSHPVTKQLTRLYNSVKPLLDTAYGAQNLQEFVAEAWGNPEFRAKLSAMTPDGTSVTAWQKFVNIVKNALRSLMGMESRGVKSAASEIDTLIEAAISPAPETRYGGSLLALSATGQAEKAFKAMSDTYNKLPYLNDDIKNNLSKFFEGTVAEKVKSFVRSAMPLNALTEVAKKYIPMAPKLMQLINLRAGTESMFNAMLEPTINRARAWAAKQDADTMRTFNDVVYMSTTNGVDPSKPRKDYLDAKGNSKVDKSGNKLVDTWDKLQPMWNSLEKSGGQTVYKEMRDTYKKLQDRIGVILEKRINEEFAGDTEKAKTANSLLQKLYKERGMIEPYFPLTRRGSYWLTYNLNGERVEEAFESPRARRMAREEIEANGGASNIEEYKRMTNINYRNAPSSSFVGRVLNVLEANDIKGDAQNEIVRMYLDALPENSFAQAFRTRKNTPGFERDAIRAFSTKPYSIARQLANLEYGAKLNNLDTEMRNHVEKGSGQAVDMYNELAKHIKFAISPDIPEWSKIATSIGFNMTLGFNLSSALVNLTQIPLITLPYLGGKYGLPESSKAIADATRIYLGSKFKDKARVDILGIKTDMKAMPSMDNYDFDSKDLPADVLKYKTLAQVAAEFGQLNRSQIYDILDVDKTDNLMTKVNAVSGFVFHHGERMNREVTLMAAFDLEMQRMKNPKKLTPEERAMTPAQLERRAAENAIELTELTNGTMSAAAAPSLAQSGIGKVLFMFKRYGVSMYYMLFKTTRDALVGQDQDVKDAARKQIAGIYGAAALLAGARGVPMFGIAAMVYNLFKDDDDDDLETATRKWMGETAYSGALNGITNLDFASRIGLSDLIFRDQKAPESQTVLLTAMEMMGGPVYGVGKKIERGITLINDGNIERGIEQMLPSAFGNGLKSIRYATEGATTLRGDAITSDMNAWNVGAQALGFAPADYNRQQEINAFAKGFERTVTKEQKKLLLNYYMAARVGDNAEMQDITARMVDFNKRHPTIAITADTLQKSMRGHAQAAAEKYHGVTFNKRLRPEIMQSVQEFE